MCALRSSAVIDSGREGPAPSLAPRAKRGSMAFSFSATILELCAWASGSLLSTNVSAASSRGFQCTLPAQCSRWPGALGAANGDELILLRCSTHQPWRKRTAPSLARTPRTSCLGSGGNDSGHIGSRRSGEPKVQLNLVVFERSTTATLSAPCNQTTCTR